MNISIRKAKSAISKTTAKKTITKKETQSNNTELPPKPRFCAEKRITKRNRRRHDNQQKKRKYTKESLVEMSAASVVVIVEGVLLRRPSVLFRVCGFSFCFKSTAKETTVSKRPLSTWQPLNRVEQYLPAKNGINSGVRRNTIGGAESSDDHVIRPEEMKEDGG